MLYQQSRILNTSMFSFSLVVEIRLGIQSTPPDMRHIAIF